MVDVSSFTRMAAWIIMPQAFQELGPPNGAKRPGCQDGPEGFKSNQETTTLSHEGPVESLLTSSNSACRCMRLHFLNPFESSTLPKLLQLPLA